MKNAFWCRKVKVNRMIEAVNSVVANSSVLRASSGQVDASALSAPIPAQPTSGEAPRAPQAPFVSPYIALDSASNKAVLQIRDGETGDVQQQFPTESRLVQIQQALEREQRREIRTTSAEQRQVEQVSPQTTDVVSVQAATSSTPSNVSTPISQAATAALSAGAQSGQTAQTSISVLA